MSSFFSLENLTTPTVVTMQSVKQADTVVKFYILSVSLAKLFYTKKQKWQIFTKICRNATV